MNLSEIYMGISEEKNRKNSINILPVMLKMSQYNMKV